MAAAPSTHHQDGLREAHVLLTPAAVFAIALGENDGIGLAAVPPARLQDKLERRASKAVLDLAMHQEWRYRSTL